MLGPVTAVPGLRLHEDEEEQDLGRDTESPEGRLGIPVGSPDPPKRPIKHPNFSHTWYKGASNAPHSMCLLPCWAFTVPAGAVSGPRVCRRWAVPAGRKSRHCQPLPARQCQSLPAGTMALSKSHTPNLPAGLFCVPKLQVRAQGRSVPQVSGSKAAYPGTLSWLKAELPRECRRKGRALCHCLWPWSGI